MATINSTLSNTLLSGTSGDDSIQNGGWWDNSNQSGGSNVTINTGAGNDYVKNYEGSSVTINTSNGDDEIDNEGIGVEINTGSGNDSVDNSYLSTACTINTGTGNDIVWNNESFCLINTDIGNDSVLNGELGYGSIINTGKGNDEIENEGYDAEINAGAGNDSVSNDGGRVIINVGTGNDYVENYGSDVTISGGTGDDTIKNLGDNILIEYCAGDGNDYIEGFRADSTLSIGGGEYSTTKSGKNIIVTVGKGKISLIGAASLSSVNIVGEETKPDENTWTLDGTTATYGTSSKTLVTVKGVKSTSGLSLSGKVVTVKKASVNAAKITISGEGYTLKLGDDVSAPSKNKVWSLNDTTATYNQTTSAGYKLASDSKSITYSTSSTKTLATVTGVKSLDGLSLSGNVVTVAASSLNKKKVTISGDGYTLALADDVTAPTTKKAAWSLSGTTATYKSSYKTAGYKLASNGKSISYSKATTATTLASVKGAKAKPTISNDIIKLKTSTINSKVTLSGSYEFDFASGDYKKAKVLGSSSADKITSHGKNISLNGGKGNDTIKVYGSATSIKGGAGADVFIFDGGSGVITDYAAEDKISIASGTVNATTSGNNVIFTVGSKKITVKGGKDKKITYFDADGEHIYPSVDDEKIITLTEDHDEEIYTFGSKLRTLDASAVQLPLNITGNNYMNSIIGGLDDDTIDGGGAADTIYGGAGNDSIFGGKGNDILTGGKGNDTLKGGSGSDIFVYSKGDGKDVIQDYTADEDIISIASGVADIKTSGKNVIFTVGSGKITVKGGKSQVIAYSDDSGSESYYFNMVNIDGVNKIAKLSANYSAESLKATDFDAITEVTTIDASAVHSGLRITGSGKNESIIGGYGNDTIIGGTGKDSLTGGTGKDYFRYESGDGNDVIEDYSPEDNDVIQIMSGHVSDEVAVEGYDVVFSMVGGGSIRVKKGKGKEITFVNKKDEVISPSGTYTKSTMQDATWFTEDDTNFNTGQLDSIIKTTTAAAYQLELTTPLTNDKTLITYTGKK